MTPPLSFQIPLNTSADQFARLEELQQVFASVCNAIAPVASAQRCWNRVTLHHLVYRDMRAQFPALGSQMVCNAIYAVCKMSRLVYQHPNSPFQVKKMDNKPLPTLNFANSCPVYFDAHTLTLLADKLSVYTMDGRIKFLLTLSDEQQTTLAHHRLVETVLNRNSQGHFMLTFIFASPTEPQAQVRAEAAAQALIAALPLPLPSALPGQSAVHLAQSVLPSYVKLETHS